ncbi:MAG: aspartate/glutamate racemase family protein [Mogibacterium sp.]|nr:aspartate/glutamate racemase family protein [Mogibacterium sp.]
MLKTIGIMGGMGPASTVDLMNRIISMTEADSDQEHIPMIVDNNTRIPDRTEAILFGGKNPAPEMALSAAKLEAAGADFIVIACNAAHYFIPQIKDKISIPILDMTEETAKLLIIKGVKRAAVLATDGTIQSGFFEHALERVGIQTVYPNEEQQKLVMSLVYNYIKKGVTDVNDLPKEEMTNLVGDLSNQGAEVLILASTELPIAFSIMGLRSDAFVDPTNILAKSAIRMAGAKIRKSHDN